MDWRQLFRLGFLTTSLVIAAAVVVAMVSPHIDLGAALILIALVALFLGWVL